MEEIDINNSGTSSESHRVISMPINERSELVQEVINNEPAFIERWALLFFLGILILILGATRFLKYPDVVETTAILTAQNAPKEIIPNQNGRIVNLLVKNNELVKKNQLIAWIESTANHNEVISLSFEVDESISRLNTDKLITASKLFNRSYQNLGELQPYYQQFIVALQAFNDYMVNGFYNAKKTMMVNDLASLDSGKHFLLKQKSLTQQDVKLAEDSYNMNKLLLDQKVLTLEEFRNQTSKYVGKQLSIPQLEGSLLAIETQKRDKTKEIDQLNHDAAQQNIIFRESIQSLKSHVDDWIKQYCIKAPVTGTIAFTVPLQENQTVQTGKIIGYVNPIQNGFYLETFLSQYNFGKINTGLLVQLRFDAYPYEEVGTVEGKITYISKVPSDSGFLATIQLPKGLMTNKRTILPYKNRLKAQAIIITKNMTLMERLYYSVVKSLSVGNK